MYGNGVCVINHSCEPNCFLESSTWRARGTSSSLPTLYCFLRGEELMYDYKSPLTMPATRCRVTMVPSAAEAVATCHDPCCQLGPSLGTSSSLPEHLTPPSCSGWMWACRWQGLCLPTSRPPSNYPLPTLGPQNIDTAQRFLNPFSPMLEWDPRWQPDPPPPKSISVKNKNINQFHTHGFSFILIIHIRKDRLFLIIVKESREVVKGIWKVKYLGLNNVAEIRRKEIS